MGSESLAHIFGRRLRVLREAAGLTQEQLGKSAGVDYKHIGAIERGEKVPSFEAIERVANALGADYYELFLPDDLRLPKADQTLTLAVREIQHGSPELRNFVIDVLVAARKLAETTRS